MCGTYYKCVIGSIVYKMCKTYCRLIEAFLILGLKSWKDIKYDKNLGTEDNKEMWLGCGNKSR